MRSFDISFAEQAFEQAVELPIIWGARCSCDVFVMNLFSQDVPLKGFPVDLRKYRQHAFSGVSIRQNQDGTSHVFCVSKKGFLLEINNQRRIVRVQNLKVIDLQLSMV